MHTHTHTHISYEDEWIKRICYPCTHTHTSYEDEWIKRMCYACTHTHTHTHTHTQLWKRMNAISSVDLKKCTTWELWVKFCLGQNEDCSLRDSTLADSSEKLLQRGRRGKVSIHMIFGEENICSQAHSFPEVFYNLMKAFLFKRNSHHHEGF